MLTPKVTATRELLSLDGLWSFAVDDDALHTPWAAPLQTELQAPVPASYNDLFIDQKIRDHVGWVWYQRTVRVPRGWRDERVLVRVDAATHRGVVYVDDRLVAEHEGGYLPFEADITDLVTAGAEFRLTIGVDNRLTPDTIPPGTVVTRQDGSQAQTYMHDFYNYAGLHRTVWLASRPRVHVDDVTVVTDIDGETGVVDYRVDLDGDAEVRVRLLDEDGRAVASTTGAAGSLRVEAAHLWKPGAAYLYSLVVEAVDGGVVVDEYPVNVGIRTVAVDGGRFLINGEPFHFTGFGKHEDTAVRGKGHDNAYLVHDFQLLDWIGANSFRTSHYPYAEEVMDFADRHGIVVIDETAAVGLNKKIGGGIADMLGGAGDKDFADGFGPKMQEAHKREIRELIARDKNHPCVVMWSIANEPDTMSEGTDTYFEPLFALARDLDPTRPVTFVNVMMAPPNVCRVSKFADVLCLNRYYGWYVDGGDLATAEAHLEQELRGWEQMYGKPMIMTEYGADTIAGYHSVWDQPWTEEYQAKMLDVYHRVFDRVETMVGEQVWNFADFQTSSGFFRVDGNKKGVFTRDRKPKAAAHALRARWTRIIEN
ncbi:beta-glucuronidase [Microbacterium horticulturae]|uniref:Beta-glucuronidase n=1 Tax=Microbacterium horticulturae TaxID=3028316 RepID=A0ABY8BY56_9MICO|nr:beta-glucuronidase [Microbacterium sp. KACC 23027]WEG09130.1 beta-glucuronidase [Microbacterium sp. KACC 23027]